MILSQYFTRDILLWFNIFVISAVASTTIYHLLSTPNYVSKVTVKLIFFLLLQNKYTTLSLKFAVEVAVRQNQSALSLISVCDGTVSSWQLHTWKSVVYADRNDPLFYKNIARIQSAGSQFSWVPSSCAHWHRVIQTAGNLSAFTD